MSKQTKYVFRRLSDDERITRMLSHRQFEKCRLFGTRFRLQNGDEVTLIDTEFDKMASIKSERQKKLTYPMVSMSLGVHSSQAAEFNEQARRNRTGAEYRADGTCVLSSRHARKRECATRGVFDQDAGYGDQAPQRAISEDDPFI